MVIDMAEWKSREHLEAHFAWHGSEQGEPANATGEEVTDVTPMEALNALHRKIVAVHYGLAEHGPTEPKETAMWAMRELRGVLNYIQAIKRAQPTSS